MRPLFNFRLCGPSFYSVQIWVCDALDLSNDRLGGGKSFIDAMQTNGNTIMIDSRLPVPLRPSFPS